MKILHIHPSMQGGGIESMICGLANEMAETEDVTVCSIFEPKESDVFWGKLSPKVKKTHLGKRKPGFSIKEIFKIFNFIRKGNFDAVSLHGFMFYYILSVVFLHSKVKFFYTVHSDAKMECSGWDKKFFAIKRFFFRHGWVRPITISDVSKQSFTEFYGCDSHLIFNGVPRPALSGEDPVKKYRKTADTVVFIHAGRIDTPKNQVVLCKVFDRIIRTGQDAVLLIAGSKQKEQIYEQLVPYFSDRIIYLGERNDVPQLMSCSDAMCLPSIWEGLPVTLLESLSVGCVPICSPVGGIPDVISDGVNGILSASSGEEDYYAAVMRYLEMSIEQRKSLAGRVRSSFEKYDISNTAKEYIKYYLS